MSTITNVMTAVHSRTYSVKNIGTSSQHQETVVLQRSYTCRRKESLRIPRNLSVTNRKVYSTPSTPSMRSHRKLSCHSSVSQDDCSGSRKSSVLSLGEKISSLLSIPGKVLTINYLSILFNNKIPR